MSMAARLTTLALSLSAVATLPGCFFQGMSIAEIQEAVDGLVLAGQIQTLEDGTLELTTDFTIADGVQAILDERRAFLASQLPCSTVETITDGLRIDFGVLGDDCEYRGMTFAGVAEVTVRAEGSSYVVAHDYQGLTNGVVRLDGSVDATWSQGSRRVITALVGTRLADERSLTIDADRVFTLRDADAGLAGGFVIDGTRSWQLEDALPWSMTIDGVTVRWEDPVPEDGVYSVTAPSGAGASLSFDRIDDDTIALTLATGRRARVFHVSKSGAVDDKGDV
jgi:hypothetical protein